MQRSLEGPREPQHVHLIGLSCRINCTYRLHTRFMPPHVQPLQVQVASPDSEGCRLLAGFHLRADIRLHQGNHYLSATLSTAGAEHWHSCNVQPLLPVYVTILCCTSSCRSLHMKRTCDSTSSPICKSTHDHP